MLRSLSNILFALAIVGLVGCGGGATNTTPTTGGSNGSGTNTGSSSSSGSTSSGGASGSGSTGSGQTAFQSQTYDLSADFSLTQSFSHVWQYGYSATNSLLPDQFRLAGSADTSNPNIGFWHASTNANTGVTSGYYPYIAKNTTNATLTDPTNHWATRAGEIAMEGSGSGQYSLVRFVAPAAGKYQITAAFEGIHFNLSTTDVHVLQNGASVFDANIDGYGGDPAFHVVQGANPSANYTGTLSLNTGDILTFAVGIGANQTNYNDTTGLFVHIVTVP